MGVKLSLQKTEGCSKEDVLYLLVWLQFGLLEPCGFNIPVDADLRRLCGHAPLIDLSNFLILYDVHIFMGFFKLKIVKINTCRIQNITICIPCMLNQIIVWQ